MDHQQEFFKKVSQWEHPLELVLAGQQVDSYFTLDDLFYAREVASNASPLQRKMRQESFFHPDMAKRARIGQGVHDRCEAIAFADGEISEEDLKGLERHLPLRLKATCIMEKVIPTGETWNVTVSPLHWNLSKQEDVYRLVNIGTLTMEAGSSLVVEGNVFSLLVQELHTPPDCPAHLHPQIKIMPTPYSVDFGQGPHNGPDGTDGLPGLVGRAGTIPELGATLLGMYMNGTYAEEEFDGKDGSEGTNGTDGKPGRNGGMCKLAEITIRNLHGPIGVAVKAGNGGEGGNGGIGGDGGKGGDGTPAYRLYTGWSKPGNGGNGGNAGSGGNGGRGGSGGICSNIYLSIPPEKAAWVGLRADISSGGKGGKGGLSGNGGAAGKGGNGPEPGQDGQDGWQGKHGRDGRNGNDRNPPAIFMNEVPVNLDQDGTPIPVYQYPVTVSTEKFNTPNQLKEVLHPNECRYVSE